jgi:heme/copper-type cytochrome/quinol oxidase subunit 4
LYCKLVLLVFDLIYFLHLIKKKKETKWWRKWTHEIYTPTIKDFNDKNRI